MPFYQRLAYYLLGILVGGIFLKFVLDFTGSKGLDFTYLPNARVLKNIRNKPFYYDSIAYKKLIENSIDTIQIKKILTEGDVDFSKSNKPLKGGKVYFIEGQTDKKKQVTLEIINYESKVVLKDILK